MPHIVVPEAEAMLDKEFSVLDRGYVRLVDYMGSDARIVAAARVSYGQGTKSVREDKGLIAYLMRNDHTSPFEQVELAFHVKLPIFVARQWIRHRTAHVNEYSGRYSVMEDEFYYPKLQNIRRQSAHNRQGRDETVAPELAQKVLALLQEDAARAYGHYTDMLEDGVARELARMNLPLNVYTQWYWKIDLHNLFHFLRLRLDAHAQWEIRAYADVLFTIARAVAPWSCAAFEEHSLHGLRLSRTETDIVKRLLGEKAELRVDDPKEAKRLQERLRRLGITVVAAEQRAPAAAAAQ